MLDSIILQNKGGSSDKFRALQKNKLMEKIYKFRLDKEDGNKIDDGWTNLQIEADQN